MVSNYSPCGRNYRQFCILLMFLSRSCTSIVDKNDHSLIYTFNNRNGDSAKKFMPGVYIVKTLEIYYDISGSPVISGF